MNKLITFSFFAVTTFFQAIAWGQVPVIETTRTSGWDLDGYAVFTNSSEFPTTDYTWRWYAVPNLIVQYEGDTLSNQGYGPYKLVLLDMTNNIDTTVYFYIGGDCSVYGYPNIDSSYIVNAVPGMDIGYIEPYPTGGVGGNAWTWSNGSTNANQSGLSPGTYTAIVTDQFDCSDTATYTILLDTNGVQPFLPNVSFSYNEPTANYAAVVVRPTGGIPPYLSVFSDGTIMDGAGGSAYDYTNWTGLQHVTCSDAGGDTVVVPFIISAQETTFGDIPYPDSLISNNFYCGILENCDIDYSNVDSAHVYHVDFDSLAQELYITWAIYTSTDIIYLNDSIPFSGDSGLYTLNVSVYCPQKNGSYYMTILEQIQLNNDLELVSIEENAMEAVKLAPNPFTDGISIYGVSDINEIHVMDVFGRDIPSEYIYDGNCFRLTFQNKELPSGTYYVRLSNSKGSKTFKLAH